MKNTLKAKSKEVTEVTEVLVVNIEKKINPTGRIIELNADRKRLLLSKNLAPMQVTMDQLPKRQ